MPAIASLEGLKEPRPYLRFPVRSWLPTFDPQKALHFFQISDILNSEEYKEAQRANCKIHHGRN
jgi:hypothetical protein